MTATTAGGAMIDGAMTDATIADATIAGATIAGAIVIVRDRATIAADRGVVQARSGAEEGLPFPQRGASSRGV